MDKVKVEAPVRATEDPEKVGEAVLNVFPELEIEVEDDAVRGTGDSGASGTSRRPLKEEDKAHGKEYTQKTPQGQFNMVLH